MPAGISSDRRSALAALLRASRSLASVSAGIALAGALVGLLVLGLLPRTGLYRPVTVLSGSMRPAFAPGDMVFVTPEPVRDVRIGQVISYRIPIADHHVQSHRVIAVVRRNGHVAVRTKGDANAAADPWTAQLNGSTAWRVRLVVPKIGWLIFWLRLPLVHELTVLLAPLLLAILALVRVWQRDEGGEDADAAGAVAT